MWLRIYIVLFCAVGAPVSGGMTYRFEIVNDSDELPRGRSEARGMVWVDGDRSRVEYERDEEEAFAYHVLIYKVGEPGAVAINTELKTFYDQAPALPAKRMPLPPVELSAAEVELAEHLEAEEVSGFSCRKHTLTISYVEKTDYGSEVVEQRVSAEYVIWTTAELPELVPPSSVDAKNFFVGWRQIDDEVEEKLRQVEGFPVRRQLSRTRQYVDGATLITDSKLLLFDFRAAEVPAAKFEIPAGYRYSEPQILGPGM